MHTASVLVDLIDMLIQILLGRLHTFACVMNNDSMTGRSSLRPQGLRSMVNPLMGVASSMLLISYTDRN
jgi:hypothetical protein